MGKGEIIVFLVAMHRKCCVSFARHLFQPRLKSSEFLSMSRSTTVFFCHAPAWTKQYIHSIHELLCACIFRDTCKDATLSPAHSQDFLTAYLINARLYILYALQCPGTFATLVTIFYHLINLLSPLWFIPPAHLQMQPRGGGRIAHSQLKHVSSFTS